MTSTAPETAGPAGLGGPVLGEALAAAHAAAARLAEVVRSLGVLTSTTAAQRRDALVETAVLRRVTDAVHLALVESFTRLELDALGATSRADLLAGATGASRGLGKRHEQLARATGSGDGTQPAMPALTALHAAGRISTEVFELAARTLRALPRALRTAHAAALDATLAEDLPELSHAEAEQLCSDLLDVLDPDRADRGFDPDSHERRSLDVTRYDDGFVGVRGRLDPVTGAQLIAALDHYSKPAPPTEVEVAPDDPAHPEEAGASGRGTRVLDHDDEGRLVEDETTWDGAPAPHGPEGPRVTVRDVRTATQRRADALGLIALQGVSHSETRGGEPPRIVVVATEGQLRGLPGAGRAVCEQTGPLPSTALRALVSRASIQAVITSAEGATATVLALGRTVRLFTPQQRRAMHARDGGCAVPGCGAPLAWLQAHHVVEWAAQGRTDVSSGVLLCPHHHLLVTLGVWEVRMVDAAPQVRPPAAVDPLRRWLVNPRAALRARARERGRQLLLDLVPPPAPPPDAGGGDGSWRYAPAASPPLAASST